MTRVTRVREESVRRGTRGSQLGIHIWYAYEMKIMMMVVIMIMMTWHESASH